MDVYRYTLVPGGVESGICAVRVLVEDFSKRRFNTAPFKLCNIVIRQNQTYWSAMGRRLMAPRRDQSVMCVCQLRSFTLCTIHTSWNLWSGERASHAARRSECHERRLPRTQQVQSMAAAENKSGLRTRFHRSLVRSCQLFPPPPRS